MVIEHHGFDSLTAKSPEITTQELLAQFVPPREFSAARFSNYRPDDAFESQREALASCAEFAGATKKRAFAKKGADGKPGIYLDGGFGVGKTHLLASIWHEFKGKKLFGSFLAYTGLIGVLGFANAVERLAKFDLLCIDEFELDDPGDTMMMSRLLSELDKHGTKFACTSNTPPNALGQGRFAAADFAREISAMSGRFAIISVDGEDYRHRPTEAHSSVLEDDALIEWAEGQSSNSVALDDFSELLKHLSTLHPSKFLQLLDGIGALGLSGVYQLHDQVAALRFVSLIDRLYECQIAVRNSGIALTEVFSAEMIAGGYRKKYLRAVSRLGALTSL